MLDFSQRRELSLHAELAADVNGVLAALGMPGIIVGAFVRDLHLHYGAGIPIQRGKRWALLTKFRSPEMSRSRSCPLHHLRS